MKLEKSDSFIMFSPDNQSVDSFLEEVIKHSETLNSNFIIHLLEKKVTNIEIILITLRLLKSRQQNKSVVFVSENLNVEDFPDDVGLVPTLTEAKDLIELEEIERDLGL